MPSTSRIHLRNEALDNIFQSFSETGGQLPRTRPAYDMQLPPLIEDIEMGALTFR